MFYNVNADAMIKFDLDNLDADELKSKYMERLFKLYKAGGKDQEAFADEDIYVHDEVNAKNYEISSEDIYTETKFEELVKKFYEVNKIKNVEVEPNNDSQDSVYVSLVNTVKNRYKSGIVDINKLIDDPTIKADLTRYAGMKKKETQNLLKAEENSNKEIEILYNEFKKLPDIDVESYSSIEEQVDKRAATDPRLAELSHTPISVLSKEYINKQFKDDIISIASSLSNNTILPLTLNKIDFTDNSNSNNQLYKLNLGYIVNINGVNKDIRFSVDIPKVVDDHFLYLKGTRYTIDNQLAFLPVTKTAPDSVKITTNYSILFVDREKGFLSKTINQTMKLIDARKNDPRIKVRYGDSLLSYSKNKIRDVEYSEVCKNIYSIEASGQYRLIFNFDDIAGDLKLNNAPSKY